jgi:hypothetical protein
MECERLYRAGSLVTVSKKLSDSDTKYEFFYGNGNENHEFGTGSFVYKRIISAVSWVEFASDGMSYIILRGCNFCSEHS